VQKEDIDPALIPRPGMSFRNREEARKFYSIYAEEVGFGLCYGNNKPYSYIIHCNNEGNNTYFKKKKSCVLGTIPPRRHTACPR
jgi:hypothetical protein